MTYKNKNIHRVTIFLLLLFAFFNNKAQIKFSTDFESGSLADYRLVDSTWNKDYAMPCLSYLITSKSDPLNPVDTTLAPSARWFFFCMTGVKDKQIILNFNETDPLRPVYSYDKVNYERFAGIADTCTLHREIEDDRPCYLFMQRFTKDTVYVAYFIPYDYSYLQKRINNWIQYPYVKFDTIGYSRKGLPMQMLTITDSSVPDSQKKKVWIHGRIHPSESPASWHLDGFIDALVANTSQAIAYRKAMTLYIVPFANPDGVVEGLSRSNSTGVNIEINWAKPEEQTEPEVRALKATMEKITTDRPFDMQLNMHSQTINNVTYWVHTASSTSDYFYKKELKLCYFTMFDRTYFGKEDLVFSDLAERYAEGWAWNRAGDKTLALTFETPYTYYNNNPNLWLTSENLRNFGAISLTAVGDYFGISSPDRIYLSNRNAKAKNAWEKIDYLPKASYPDILLLDDLLVKAKKKGSTISYSTGKLLAGTYKIYRWIPGSVTNHQDESNNFWKPIALHTQKKTGTFELKLKATEAGELFDALLLVRER